MENKKINKEKIRKALEKAMKISTNIIKYNSYSIKTEYYKPLYTIGYNTYSITINSNVYELASIDIDVWSDWLILSNISITHYVQCIIDFINELNNQLELIKTDIINNNIDNYIGE